MLALDVSASVDADEDRRQREGLAAALTSQEVVEAFLVRPAAPVALSAFEWSGRAQQRLLLDWRLIRSADDLRNVADRIAGSHRAVSEFPTALGYALGWASRHFDDAPADCRRHTLDVSGDGLNNHGFSPEAAYRAFPFDGVTVNGLAIGGSEDLRILVAYYSRHLIRGPGAFVEVATDHDDFARAMRRKLVRELSPPALSRHEPPRRPRRVAEPQ